MKKDVVAHSDLKLDFNDILIKPTTQTDFDTRSVIDYTDGNGMLPLFTAPMDTVVNTKNAQTFQDEGINICLPRGEQGNNGQFTSHSLKNFREIYLTDDEAVTMSTQHILIV